MHVLYCYWGEHPAPAMTKALQEAGHCVTKYPFVSKNYNHDDTFTENLTNVLESKSYDFLFSFDFFPLISQVASNLQIPYLSWIYDMPHTTLYAPQAYSAFNHIFLFDRSFMLQLQQQNHKAHFYYLPLAGVINPSACATDSGMHTVSFIGSLYEKCLYHQISYLPDSLRGYLDGFFTAQAGNYFFHLTDEILTPEIYQQLKKWVTLELSESYRASERDLYMDLLDKKVTNLDRTLLLNACSNHFPLSFYSGSPKSFLPLAHHLGYADYETQMPSIFHGSKINLNFTLRSIRSGIPLRCMDIMGSGGFLLSAYQPELAELFCDGEEMALFFNEADMLDKIAYYVSHEKKRSEIARNGLHKIQTLYTYSHQADTMLRAAFPGS